MGLGMRRSGFVPTQPRPSWGTGGAAASLSDSCSAFMSVREKKELIEPSAFAGRSSGISTYAVDDGPLRQVL